MRRSPRLSPEALEPHLRVVVVEYYSERAPTLREVGREIGVSHEAVRLRLVAGGRPYERPCAGR